MTRVYLLYDGRAANGNTDEALIYCIADSMEEALRDKKEMFPDAIIYSYKKEGMDLLDEKIEDCEI